MTHYLDALPLDYGNPAVQELRNFLASNYYHQKEVLKIVVDAAVDPAKIQWEQPPILLWHDVLGVARNDNKLRMLLATVQKSDVAIGTRLDEFLIDVPVVEATPTNDGAPAKWTGFDEPEDREQLERLIVEDRNTLLDVSFLERGLEIAPAVARLRVQHKKRSHGTAFRIGEDLVLTNHHVLFDWERGDDPAQSVEAWFGYEREFGGEQLAHDVAWGDVESIVGDKDEDWAVIRMKTAPPDEYPILKLPENAAPVVQDDRVYIIQHPEGGPKKIGMHHNLVRYADDTVVQYWTDTMAGASGSPVFNRDWEIVALHHRWLEVELDGKTEYRNQGRAIGRIHSALEERHLV